MAKGGKGKAANKGPAARPRAQGLPQGFSALDEEHFRGVSGGGTRGKVPAPPSGSGPKGDQPKDELALWVAPDAPWWVASVLESTEPDWLGFAPVDDPRCEQWMEWAEKLGEEKPSLALVFRHLLNDSDGTDTEVDIFRALMKILTPGRMPRIVDGAAYEGALDSWTRKDDAKMLEEAKGVHHRYQGADSMLMAAPLAIWPPPLELVRPGELIGESASVCWEVRFDKYACKDALLGWSKPDPKGRPTHTWFLKALGVRASERHNMDEVEVGSMDDGTLCTGRAVYAPQCALCLERPGGSGSHEHSQCPLIGTLNKIRQQGELEPLRFQDGVLVRKDDKVPLDATKEIRALKVLIARFEERLAKLEAPGPQAGPSGPPPSKGKKRKQEAGGSGNAPPAKKGKGGGGQAGQKGGPGGGGPKDKGKGGPPAGGSGGATTWA
ncbi:hypothetical protein HD554DRAFT_2258452 [Boletus coccyginus]|nr:hypothetical protein HD554DRAFT_2258452 [Boletus coccyginus]